MLPEYEAIIIERVHCNSCLREVVYTDKTVVNHSSYEKHLYELVLHCPFCFNGKIEVPVKYYTHP